MFCFFVEEFLLVLPLMNLLLSPSKSVKATATYLLSMLERHLLDMLITPEKIQFSQIDASGPIKSISIIRRLLHHLWFPVIFHMLQACICNYFLCLTDNVLLALSCFLNYCPKFLKCSIDYNNFLFYFQDQFSKSSLYFLEISSDKELLPPGKNDNLTSWIYQLREYLILNIDSLEFKRNFGSQGSILPGSLLLLHFIG